MIARPLWGALGALLLAGCVTTSSQSPLQRHAGAEGLRANELRLRLRERLPRYVGTIERLADDAGLEASSLQERARITRFEIDAASQMQLAVFRTDPLAALVDTWTLTLQLQAYLHRRAAEGELSAHQLALADQAFTGMERDLEGLLADTAGSADVARVRDRVYAWARAHPVDAISARPSTVELFASITSSAPAGSLGAAAAQLAETTQDLLERMDVIGAMLPREARWQAEYLLERGAQPLSREATQTAVGATLDALTTPENRDRMKALVRDAVDAALRSSLGTTTSAPPGLPPPPDPVIQASWRSPAILQAAAPVPRQDALAVQLARETGRAAARALSEEMIRQLGARGEGPLGIAVTDTAARVSAAAIQGARGELQASIFPQCQGPDRPRCVEENLARLSGTFSAGAARGVRSELSLLPVALAFLAGAAAVLLVWIGWALRGSSETRLQRRARA